MTDLQQYAETQLLRLSNEIYKAKLEATLYHNYIESITELNVLFNINNTLSTQSFSKYPENLLCLKLNGKKLNVKEKSGDFTCETYGNVEYKYCIKKHSTTHFGHWLQIRKNHNINNYILQTYNEDTKELKTYLLSKNDMLKELLQSSTNTHNNNEEEKTITLNENREIDWDNKYLINL